MAKSNWRSCTSSMQAGIAGAGNGQFSGPTAIVIAGGTIYVSTTATTASRSSTKNCEYVTKFGTKGTGRGDFEGPRGNRGRLCW